MCDGNRYKSSGRHFACLLLLACWPSAQAAIKCWTNSEGHRECGNAVPPEYSQQGHKTIDEQGLIVDETKAAPTEQELEAMRQRELEAERLRLEKEKRDREDRVLLDTFPEESDIIRARDSKMITIDGQILLENEKIKKLQAQLAASENRRQGYIDKEQEVPEVLLINITDLKRQIENAHKYVEQSSKDKDNISKEYDAYLKRHRQLKGVTPQQQATPP